MNGEQEEKGRQGRREGGSEGWLPRPAGPRARSRGRLGKGEAKLIRRAMSAQESKKSRYLKYGIFTLIGLAIGAAIARSRKGETSGESSSYTGTTGPPRPRPGQPGRRAGPDLGQRHPDRDGGGGGQQGPGAPTAPAPSETTPIPLPDP